MRIGPWLPLMMSLLLISACAASQVTPVAMSQPGDGALDCGQLSAQRSSNNQQALVLLHDDSIVADRNAAKTVAGVLPGIGILIVLSTDLSNSEQIRARALIDRDEELAYLMKKQDCREAL